MYIVLNPQYEIRNEPNCSYIIRRSEVIDQKNDFVTASVEIIPPFLGFILTNIGKKVYEESLKSISEELSIGTDKLRIFIEKLIENDSAKKLDVSGQEVILPKRLLLYADTSDNRVFKTTKGVLPMDSFEPHRPLTPINMNLMVTTQCTTNCIYCYAKRIEKNELNTQKIISLIDEAHTLGVINLILTGGDIFVHKGWPDILRKAVEKKYSPFISTKTPLSVNDFEILVGLGVGSIQFSLDSVNTETLHKLLGVSSLYFEKVDVMFKLCEKFGVKVSIRSVLTNLNSTKEEIQELYQYLSRFTCIEKWVLTPAFYSEHQKDYNKYMVSNERLSLIFNYTQNIKTDFPILYNKIGKSGYSMSKYKSENDFIKYNQTCYANSYSMSILSSGKCTICEMLYDNRDYVLGDVHDQNIENIWNSEKALMLYSKHQSLITDNSTPCIDCKVYDICKNKIAKKICYVDISKIYGEGKFEYPDPRCPKATDTNLIL